MILQQIVELIERNDSFLVVAHENPDGDAIGSTLGLALALRQMGKAATPFNIEPVPESMHYLPGVDLFRHQLDATDQFDVVFALDSGESSRTGIDVEKHGKSVVNIDHHPHSEFGDICYVDTASSATAILIYRLLLQAQHPVTDDVAESLYLGILSDTGSFRYSSANTEAFDVASKLVATGIDPWDTASNLYESYAPQRMQLLGKVLSTLDISTCGRYASLSMNHQDLNSCGALPEHADGFVNYARAIRGIEVALFISENGHSEYKISMRSRGLVDVGTLARQLGGGGHHNAAGARLKGSLPEVKASLAQHLDGLLG